MEMFQHSGGSRGDPSLVTSPRAPPGEKRSGERSRISWAYSHLATFKISCGKPAQKKHGYSENPIKKKHGYSNGDDKFERCKGVLRNN